MTSSKRSDVSQAMQSRRSDNASAASVHSASKASNVSASSRGSKGAPSPLKPEKQMVRRNSEPDFAPRRFDFRPPPGRPAPYPSARQRFDVDAWNVPDDASDRDVAMMKMPGGKLVYMNTAEIEDLWERSDGSETSRKMSEPSMMSSLSTMSGSTRSACSSARGAPSGSAPGSMRRSQSAGSIRSSGNRSVRSAEVTSVSSYPSGTFGIRSRSSAFDGFAPMSVRVYDPYPNAGREQVFRDDSSLRVQQVNSYRRNAFGGGFIWSSKEPCEPLKSPVASSYAQNTRFVPPKYGFKTGFEEPLKHIRTRCNPDAAGPGFKRTPYGGFYARYIEQCD